MSEPLSDFRQDDYQRLLERFIALGYDFFATWRDWLWVGAACSAGTT